MSLYERVASQLIGTPLQRPAEWLRRAKGAGFRRRHPELVEIFREEERIDRVMRAAIGERTNCIDVGCHVGAYLARIVTLAPNGQHLAIEPVPHKAAWLRKKFPGVSVLEVALADTEGPEDFFVDRARTALSGLRTPPSARGGETLRVQCRRLDALVDADAAVGFIKVDVNGAELPALRGARDLLRRDRPFVLLGCTQGGLDRYGICSEEVVEFLVGQVGYRIFLLKDYLDGSAPLDAKAFSRSMIYPFQALNYAVVPVGSS